MPLRKIMAATCIAMLLATALLVFLDEIALIDGVVQVSNLSGWILLLAFFVGSFASATALRD